MSHKRQDASQVSPDLDEMVCDLIGYMLFELADEGDRFAWADPAPAGAEEPLI